jgi:hypothetical protein
MSLKTTIGGKEYEIPQLVSDYPLTYVHNWRFEKVS